MADLVLRTNMADAVGNSYADVAFADEYFESHPFYSDAWGDLDSARKANLLISATLDLDLLFTWNLETSYLSVVPANVKMATAEQALFLSRSSSNIDAPSGSGGLEELKIDVVHLKFGGSTAQQPVAKRALLLLRAYATAHFASRVRKVQVTF